MQPTDKIGALSFYNADNMAIMKTFKDSFMKYSGFEKEEHFDRISFYNGDCMDLLKQTPDKYYDLALVDPPYGIDINMNMGRRKGEKAKHKIKQWDKGTPNDEYFAELMRISKNQIIWGGNYFALPLTGGWIFWNKNVPEGVSFADGELAWTSFKMVLKKINPYLYWI